MQRAVAARLAVRKQSLPFPEKGFSIGCRDQNGTTADRQAEDGLYPFAGEDGFIPQGIDNIVAAVTDDGTGQGKIIVVPIIFGPVYQIPLHRDILKQAVVPRIGGKSVNDGDYGRITGLQEGSVAGKFIIRQRKERKEQGIIRSRI